MQHAAGVAGSNGTWTVTIQGLESANANDFFISATENGNAVGTCGTGCGTNQTLHVGSMPNSSGIFFCTTGDCGAAYDAGGTGSFGGTSTTTNKRAESPVINCTGQSNITLSFKYMENGQGASDDASLWYFNGTTWAQIDQLAKTVTCGGGQGTWTAFFLALPASANNNPNVKIGFLWVNNNDGMGTDPSFAVDDVTLTSSVTAANPVVNITPSATTTCITSTLTLNGSATNGPITSYSWSVSPSAGVTFIPNAGTPTVSATFTTAGVYTFTLTATNSSGSGQAVQTITVDPLITPTVTILANPNTGTVCAGTPVNFTATVNGGGTNPAYQWQVDGANTGLNMSTFIYTSTAGTHTISSIITPTASCTAPGTGTYILTVQTVSSPSVSITASPSNTVCTGSTVTFSATSVNGGTAPAYQWHLNGINSGTNASTYTLTPNNGDNIYATLTSNAACALPLTANSNTITITVNSGTPVTAGPTKNICKGDTTSLSATGTNWHWQPATGLSCVSCQNPKASPGATTVYTVTASAGSCTSTATETVNVTPSAIALFADSGMVKAIPQTIYFENLSQSGNGNYYWDFGDGNTSLSSNPAHVYGIAGVYTVELIAYGANNCNDTTYMPLIIADSVYLSVPNVFSPNQDGINDYWWPNAHGMRSVHVLIYDRWGAKMADMDMSRQYWDGHTTSGLECTEGTYFYVIDATDINNKDYHLHSFLQLVR